MVAVRNVAAAHVGVVASLVEHASDLANRATSYPLAAKVVFVATFVLVLSSIFVYALLLPTTNAEDDSPAAPKPNG